MARVPAGGCKPSKASGGCPPGLSCDGGEGLGDALGAVMLPNAEIARTFLWRRHRPAKSPAALGSRALRYACRLVLNRNELAAARLEAADSAYDLENRSPTSRHSPGRD